MTLGFSIAPICCGVQMSVVPRGTIGHSSVQCLGCGRDN